MNYSLVVMSVGIMRDLMVFKGSGFYMGYYLLKIFYSLEFFKMFCYLIVCNIVVII